MRWFGGRPWPVGWKGGPWLGGCGGLSVVSVCLGFFYMAVFSRPKGPASLL